MQDIRTLAPFYTATAEIGPWKRKSCIAVQCSRSKPQHRPSLAPLRLYLRCVNALRLTRRTLQVVFWAPAAAGAGVTLVMAYLNGNHIPNLLRFRTLLTKIVGCAFGVASGLAIGPEGPLVHIGACVASNITYATSRRYRWLRWLVPCAGCARVRADDTASTDGADGAATDFSNPQASSAAQGTLTAQGAPTGAHAAAAPLRTWLLGLLLARRGCSVAGDRLRTCCSLHEPARA